MDPHAVPMPYRTLEANEIVETLDKLQARIDERFPGAGLADVCRELTAFAREHREKVAGIAKPNIGLRAVIYTVLLGGLTAVAFIATFIKLRIGDSDMFGFFQGVEAGINSLVLFGAALFFLITIEERLKRRQVLKDLHVLRSIGHVIDMHQLTKDPSVMLGRGLATRASPRRTMTQFELTRYLDYCSEMLSLSAKIAALYPQSFRDPVVINTVNDIEQLTTNLSRKIWQKIMILENYVDRGREALAPEPMAPQPADAWVLS